MGRSVSSASRTALRRLDESALVGSTAYGNASRGSRRAARQARRAAAAVRGPRRARALVAVQSRSNRRDRFRAAAPGERFALILRVVSGRDDGAAVAPRGFRQSGVARDAQRLLIAGDFGQRDDIEREAETRGEIEGDALVLPCRRAKPVIDVGDAKSRRKRAAVACSAAASAIESAPPLHATSTCSPCAKTPLRSIDASTSRCGRAPLTSDVRVLRSPLDVALGCVGTFVPQLLTARDTEQHLRDAAREVEPQRNNR